MTGLRVILSKHLKQGLLIEVCCSCRACMSRTSNKLPRVQEPLNRTVLRNIAQMSLVPLISPDESQNENHADLLLVSSSSCSRMCLS